jgi:DNA processing protein
MQDSFSLPVRLMDWLRLWRLLQQSSLRFHRALASFADPTTALSASDADWRAAGIGHSAVARLQQWQQTQNPELQRELDEGVAADLAWSERIDQRIITLASADYPALLREIPDAPPLLFLRGNSAVLDMPQLAIVGSRHPSHTGLSDARDFAAELSRAGVVITSGLASGIDGAAHAGALRSGGLTIAVQGTGADRAYPREHQRLYSEILHRGGLIVSEFLPGTPPLAPHFPRRNRIISGLSMGVLVVEAAPDSGSLITARLAAEHGRPVWALPGSRHHAQARGCLQLIREGASLVTETAHILEDLPAMVGWLREQLPLPVSAASEAEAGDAKPLAVAQALDASTRQLLALLGQECRHADWLIAMSGLAPAATLRALSQLEMAGLIASVPGGYERLPAGAALV